MERGSEVEYTALRALCCCCFPACDVAFTPDLTFQMWVKIMRLDSEVSEKWLVGLSVLSWPLVNG